MHRQPHAVALMIFGSLKYFIHIVKVVKLISIVIKLDEVPYFLYLVTGSVEL